MKHFSTVTELQWILKMRWSGEECISWLEDWGWTEALEGLAGGCVDNSRHPGAILVPQAKGSCNESRVSRWCGDISDSTHDYRLFPEKYQSTAFCFHPSQAPALSLILCSRDGDGRLGERATPVSYDETREGAHTWKRKDYRRTVREMVIIRS